MSDEQKLPFGSIDPEAVMEKVVREVIPPEARKTMREQALVRYAGRYRCTKCKGEWPSKELALAHFGCDVP